MEAEKILNNEDKYNLLTGRVPIMISRLLTQNFKTNDILLTKEQWSILAVLWKKDGVSQQVLADQTYRDKPSTTRLLDHLEKEQYIERKSHKTDRRQKLIFLTPKGSHIKNEIIPVLNETINQATEGLSEEQILNIKDAFLIIYQNIEKLA